MISPLAAAITDETRELRLARVIAAPPERVYAAWTQHLPRWWGPHGMTTVQCEMDLRPGGTFKTIMRAPDGTEYPTCGVFLEIVAPSRLVFTDAFAENWEPRSQPFMLAVASFEALPGACTHHTLCVKHWSAADCAKHEQIGFHQAWSESLERLAAVAVAL